MSFLARHRTTVMIVAVALLAVVLTAWLGRDDRTYADALDPQNPGGDGAQALARVLDEQGVSVDVVRSAAAFDRATTDSSTMVVVSAADRLGRSTTRRLLDHQGDAGLVVVAPGPELTSLLDIGSYAVTTSPHRPGARRLHVVRRAGAAGARRPRRSTPTGASVPGAASSSPSRGRVSPCSARRRP